METEEEKENRDSMHHTSANTHTLITHTFSTHEEEDDEDEDDDDSLFTSTRSGGKYSMTRVCVYVKIICVYMFVCVRRYTCFKDLTERFAGDQTEQSPVAEGTGG